MKPKSATPETARINPSDLISGNVDLLARSKALIQPSPKWLCNASQSNAKKNNDTGTIANQINRVRIAVLSRPRDTHSPSERMRFDAAFSVHSGFISKTTEG